MADIVLKDRNGKDVTYEGIETVTFDTPTEGEQATFTEGVKAEKSVPLDMSGDSQTITPDEGTLLSGVTVEKPETFLPENIRNGVEIGGVVGEFIGDTEEQTVELAMADGDMVIEPSEVGKVLSKVTIQKPETLVPENIADGVNIGGIIGLLKKGSAAVNCGMFSPTAKSVIIEHGLGAVPDLVIMWTASDFTIAGDRQVEVFGGVSSKVFNKYPVCSYFVLAKSVTSTGGSTQTWAKNTSEKGPIDVSASCPANSPNEETFSAGSDYWPLNTAGTYMWIAATGIE